MLTHPAGASALPARHHRATGPDPHRDSGAAAFTAAHAGAAAPARTDDPRTGPGPHAGPRPRAAARVASGVPAGARLSGAAHRPRTARADVRA
ncbi:hypothetical protein ACFW2N_06990, partial [Streptomyces sp. NPDC058855]